MENQIKLLMPKEMRSKLLNVCKTRWLQTIDGLKRVHEMKEPILKTLDMTADIHDGLHNKNASIDTQGVLWTSKSFQFIIHLIIVRYVILYTQPLTNKLQAKKLDVV